MQIHITFSTEAPSYPDDNMPIQSKGGYQLDFDNLEAMNPFQGSNKMALSPARPADENFTKDQTESQHTNSENIIDEPTKMESALDETLPFTPSVENSLADVSTDISSTESSVVTVVKVPAIEEQDSCTATPDEKQPAKRSPSADQDKASGSFVEDTPLPVKGSYNLDFDDLYSINPFQTGGSKIKNSPVLTRKIPDSSPLVDEPQINEDKTAGVADVPEVALQLPVQPEVTSVAAVKPPAAEPLPAVASSTEGSIKLEFGFDDGSNVKKKPPPKKFGKRPPSAKSKDLKPTSDEKPLKEAPVKHDASDVADLPVPKSLYSFDFDKFDDPNFNPFGTKTSINNSPKTSKKASPVLMETAVPEQTDEPEKEIAWYVYLFYTEYIHILHLLALLKVGVFFLPPSAGESVPASEPNPEVVRDIVKLDKVILHLTINSSDF